MAPHTRRAQGFFRVRVLFNPRAGHDAGIRVGRQDYGKGRSCRDASPRSDCVRRSLLIGRSNVRARLVSMRIRIVQIEYPIPIQFS